MKLMPFSEARANLSSAFDEIERDAEELVITRSGHQPMVVLPLDEYESMRETLYLSRGANGRMLRESIAQLNAGKTSVHDPSEFDE